MTRIEIYGEVEKKEEEKVLRLRLVPAKNGVALVAVNQRGEKLLQGNLLVITESGVRFFSYVNRDIPLPLDKKRKVRLVD